MRPRRLVPEAPRADAQPPAGGAPAGVQPPPGQNNLENINPDDVFEPRTRWPVGFQAPRYGAPVDNKARMDAVAALAARRAAAGVPAAGRPPQHQGGVLQHTDPNIPRHDPS